MKITIKPTQAEALTKCSTCPQCGKPVKRGVLVVPTVLEMRLGIGKNELYHAKCYEEGGAKHEREAA